MLAKLLRSGEGGKTTKGVWSKERILSGKLKRRSPLTPDLRPNIPSIEAPRSIRCGGILPPRRVSSHPSAVLSLCSSSRSPGFFDRRRVATLFQWEREERRSIRVDVLLWPAYEESTDPQGRSYEAARAAANWRCPSPSSIPFPLSGLAEYLIRRTPASPPPVITSPTRLSRRRRRTADHFCGLLNGTCDICIHKIPIFIKRSRRVGEKERGNKVCNSKCVAQRGSFRRVRVLRARSTLSCVSFSKTRLIF